MTQLGYVGHQAGVKEVKNRTHCEACGGKLSKTKFHKCRHDWLWKLYVKLQARWDLFRGKV